MVGLASMRRCEHPARAGAGRRAVRPRCHSPKSRTGRFCGVVSGYRYYNSSSGRWLSRDPIEEPGFQLLDTSPVEDSDQNDSGDLNMYAFVNNAPTIFIDGDGLYTMMFIGQVSMACGSYVNTWRIDFNNARPSWVAQQVTLDWTINYCGRSVNHPRPDVWWEVFRIGRNQPRFEDTDSVSLGVNGQRTMGTIKVDVISAPINRNINHRGWEVYSGGWRTRNEPGWWAAAARGTTASRSTLFNWGCCGCSANTLAMSHHP